MDAVVIVVSVVGGMFLIISLITIASTRLSFPGQIASIDQLRRDVANLEKVQSNEVIAQVTKWNQEIASAKVYRTLWWAKLFTPAGWEKVDLIDIPKMDAFGKS